MPGDDGIPKGWPTQLRSAWSAVSSKLTNLPLVFVISGSVCICHADPPADLAQLSCPTQYSEALGPGESRTPTPGVFVTGFWFFILTAPGQEMKAAI